MVNSTYQFVKNSWPAFLGLGFLLIPSYLTLGKVVLRNEELAHIPIILLVIIYLIWDKCKQELPALVPSNISGSPLLAVGLLMYFIGHSQSILALEIASHIPVIAGFILLVGGKSILKKFWFPLIFLTFIIPIPGLMLTEITSSLKQSVSYLVEQILYFFNYPISRSGVILNIGQYQLLVADACSGLHSMFSLSALGLLYLYLTRPRPIYRNILISLLILPIAFLANVVRVLVLVLVTFYFGDEAGQGFIHGFAGMLLFFVSLLLLYVIDKFVAFLSNKTTHEQTPAT